MKYDVTITVEIEMRPEAFTEEFHAEFQGNFISSFIGIDDHEAHIAQLIAYGVIEEIDGIRGADQFVEGYGKIGSFVKTARIDGTETQVQ